MIKLDDHVVRATLFPDNTSQVWQLPEELLQPGRIEAEVTWEFEREAEFMHLAQLKTLLDHCRIPARLSLPYLPYGRQDKAPDNTLTFALGSFASLLNHLEFTRVTVLDPHSNIANLLINNFVAEYPLIELGMFYEDVAAELVCYPDEGAFKKYVELYPYPWIRGDKIRNQQTGEITGYSLIGTPAAENVLIVDDICDGGRTFVLLAEELHRWGVTEISLFVTHGIFSKGLKPLHDAGIHRICTHKGEAVRADAQTVGYKPL
jgi:ribose-phosphate pyrophosphokinase